MTRLPRPVRDRLPEGAERLMTPAEVSLMFPRRPETGDAVGEPGPVVVGEDPGKSPAVPGGGGAGVAGSDPAGARQVSLPPIPARDPAANDAVCATDYCGHQMRYHWTSDWTTCTQCSCGRWRKAES